MRRSRGERGTAVGASSQTAVPSFWDGRDGQRVCVLLPELTPRARRAALQAGEFTVVVVGFAASSQFRLDVELVLPARQLRPVAQIAMGQARPGPGSLVCETKGSLGFRVLNPTLNPTLNPKVGQTKKGENGSSSTMIMAA